MNQIYAPAANTNVEKSLMLNALELTSIHALVAYAAYEKKVSEDKVRQVVLERFGISDMKNLPCEAYDEAVRFLVDLQDDVILN